MYERQVTQLENVPVAAAWSGRRYDQISSGLDLLKNVDGSGVRRLTINSKYFSRKHTGRLCQTLDPCSAARSHMHMLSKYPQYIISLLSFVSDYNCLEF